jgi:hypothetical protein
MHVQIRLAITRFEALLNAVFFPDADVLAELSAKKPLCRSRLHREAPTRSTNPSHLQY